MPSFVKTPKEHRMWDQAKSYVAKSKNKKKSELAGLDWGLVTDIFKSMKDKYADKKLPSDYPKNESTELTEAEKYMTPQEFVKSLELSSGLEKQAEEIVAAYADQHAAIDDSLRDLGFRSTKPVSAAQFVELAEKAVGGYNGFDKSAAQKIAQKLPKADFYIGRENSVMVLVEPKQNVWVKDIAELADEVSIEHPSNLIRFWWD